MNSTDIENELQVSLENIVIDENEVAEQDELAEHSLSFGFAKRHSVLINSDDDGFVLYCLPNVDLDIVQEVRRILRAPFRFEYQTPDGFEQLLTVAYQRDSSEAKQMMEDIGNEVDLYSLADEMVESEDLLENEDDEKKYRVRLRIDGVLREVLKPNRKLASLLVSRIKVMAKLDIAEKRIPQDGRISLRIGGRAVDVRVSTMPTGHGERVVLRLLDKHSARLDLQDLGMTENNRVKFAQLIDKPHGIILVTGPTGSGKSTTLYAGLSLCSRFTCYFTSRP